MYLAELAVINGDLDHCAYKEEEASRLELGIDQDVWMKEI